MKLIAVVLLIGIFARESIGASMHSMDVIVVEQPYGNFVGSPFHLQFEEAEQLSGLTISVNIKINGQPMDVQMAIGMYGKAYLLQEVSEYESTEIIQNLISTLFPSEDNANQSEKNLAGWWRRQLSSLKFNKEFKPPQVDLNDLSAVKAILPGNVEMPIIAVNGRKYQKTLSFTSDQIKSFNLMPGGNEVEISAGIFESQCSLYLWRHTDKVVVTNVDGSIFKSDFWSFLPRAHLGVAELFTKIAQNGYKFVYFSARSIFESSSTHNHLTQIRQENDTIPDGPLIMNPTSMGWEQFKVATLNDIKALFTENSFVAGYGVQKDESIYTSVDIPVNMQFIINEKSELKTKVELKQGIYENLMSTYGNMARVVDQYYPPVFNYEQTNYVKSPQEPSLSPPTSPPQKTESNPWS